MVFEVRMTTAVKAISEGGVFKPVTPIRPIFVNTGLFFALAWTFDRHFSHRFIARPGGKERPWRRGRTATWTRLLAEGQANNRSPGSGPRRHPGVGPCFEIPVWSKDTDFEKAGLGSSWYTTAGLLRRLARK